MIPCQRPYFDLSDLLAVARPGAASAAFESRAADVVGARFGLLFSDGRVAFRAGLQSLGIVGAEVVLPACICPSMAEAVLASGNRPVFADVSTENFCMTPESLEQALTAETRVVVLAHMLGYRGDAGAIRLRLGHRGILLVEDYAQHLLPKARTDGALTGDFGIMSFSRGKPISMISGGLLVTNAEEIHRKVLAFRNAHTSRASFPVSGRKLAWMVGSYVLRNRPTYNAWQWISRLTPASAKSLSAHSSDLRSTGFPPHPAEFQARLGLNQLAKLKTMSDLRRDWASRLGDSLQALPGLRPAPILSGASHVRCPVLVADRTTLGFPEAMKANGVVVGRTWEYCLPFSTKFRHAAGGRDYPGAARIYREAVELPAFPGATERDRRQIVRAVQRSLGRRD